MHKLKLNKVHFLKIFVVSKNLKVFLLLSLPFLMQFSCNTTEPPPPPDEIKPSLTLALDDTSCTEAWLQLTTKDLTLPAELTLKQYYPTGDSVTKTFSLSTPDTLLYIDSLLPNQIYKFKAVLNTTNNPPPTTNILTVSTMDTTSHNFTFQSWTFGTVGSSVLYDIAIINENNIWAVGEIMIADTSQNSYTTYNAVHWDGNEWELKQIPFTYNGQTFYSAIKAILAFNENDIWFGIASLIHWNGTVYQSISTASFFPAIVNKMWGTSSSNFYIVGTNGQIARNNGTNWQRIESGTDLDIYDIWGDYDVRENKWEILAIAAKIAVNFNKKILRINETTVDTSLSTSGIPYSLSGIWFKNRTCYVVGSGMYKKYSIDSSIRWNAIHQGISNYYLSTIRGNNINDIIVCGAFGEVLHFNGVSWKSFLNVTYINGAIGGKIKGNIVVCSGLKDNRAIILIGRR